MLRCGMAQLVARWSHESKPAVRSCLPQLIFIKNNYINNKNINKINNDKKITPENKQLINTYKQRKKHINQLEQISKGLQEQKELLKGGKKKKIGDGVYKYFMERKK